MARITSPIRRALSSLTTQEGGVPARGPKQSFVSLIIYLLSLGRLHSFLFYVELASPYYLGFGVCLIIKWFSPVHPRAVLLYMELTFSAIWVVRDSTCTADAENIPLLRQHIHA